MNLSNKKIFYISGLGFMLLITGCDKKGASNNNDSANESTNTNIPPQAILPKEDTLTLYKKSVADNVFYKAKNLGGLGIENSEDRLDLYSGILIQVNSNYDTNVTIDVMDKSDQECKNIFSYSKNSPKININLPNFTKPLTCNLSINLNAKNIKTGVVENPSISKIKVRFNLTMKAYMNNNDKNYLQFAGRDSIDDYRFMEIVDQLKAGKVSIDKLNLDNLNFLEGAKDILQTFEATNSTLSDYRMFAQFKNLKNVRLDDANINDSNIKYVLSIFPKLDKLSVQNNNLLNISPIIDTQEDLNELDLSGNSNIQNLSEIRRLKKLNKISIRKMNLTTLMPLNNVTQITDLDISENPLRKFTDLDTGYLSSLINLESLNVSVDRDNPNSTPITDKVLSDYFEALAVDNSPQNLKKFIARNRWEMKSKDCNMVNNFEENIGNIGLLNSIEYLDLHGNGCVDYLGFYSGLTSLPFMNYRKIKYLNISDAPVRDFNLVIDWLNPNIIFIFNETPRNYDSGVFMTRNVCLSIFSEGNKNRLQCDGLAPDRL